MKCKSLHKSVGWCRGTAVVAGMRGRVFFTPKDNVVVWPQVELDALGRPVSSVLEGDFELEADQKFYYLDILKGKSRHSSDPYGEAHSQMQLNKLTLVFPRIDEIAADLSAYFNNTDLLWLFQDGAGNCRVVGAENWLTVTKVSQENNMANNEANTMISVEAPDIVISPIYKGSIDTDAGMLDFSDPQCCFASGVWRNDLPWINQMFWRNSI
ncbi:MAG: hypothetical protein J1E16_05680 [Muribaculaceae bacterium]|nr:hypothetical protein [Muribaculaceae bacterium]